ncbi:chromosome segregation protein SMC [uncultured Acetatifactor sp.]|uniref:chromosome segregation protein SMC n=1 Tax=uncultured Acetatifactor sp. TaxID=1671927 RepID=UPI00261BB947|nr:chromosome segregation protein SMC [uncultured Acetatifactor sp.]
MYLKNIEVQGFKSFANKINFQFHNGITGIVGPNGSGKSNVADAVRWVLGEQRVKQLRGASMQDVIFSGTENRKPLSYAYVAITLDNTDHQLATSFDEVTVARRIYRSGESEYLINGSSCRLKDVNELFYDTGIGKEGYSIIGQGQIDKILSGKPEERRELFDEAAGIVKFKRRKAAAQTKLENEKQNLVRVNDILSELEKQLGPLERQSETARQYLRKREELKRFDVNVFLLENARLREQLGDVEEKRSLAARDLAETSQNYEGIREEYERVAEVLEKLEQSIEEARSTVTDAGLTRGKLEGEMNVLKEQINSARGSEAHLNNRRNALEEDIAARVQDREALLSEKGDTDAKVQEITALADAAKAKLEEIQTRIEELNSGIEAGKNTIIGELNQRATIKTKLGRFDTMMEQVKIRKAELQSRLLRVKSDEAAREETLKGLEAEFAAVTDQMRILNEREASMEQELSGFRQALTQKDAALQEAKSAYHMEKSRLEALSNLAERYEGYGGSVKKVMEQKERNEGIVGVVADIIHVEKKYEVAIETALGGSIQNIVTRDEDTAKRMISFLKTNRLGRATFLPLTSIRNYQRFRNTEALSEPGVIGTADTLVRIDDKYRDVAGSLLGRILVVDNVDNALKLNRKYNQSMRVVTLEGELLVPGGAISGGAYKNSSNLLGRRREIEELEKRVKELARSVSEIDKDIEDTKARRTRMRVDLEAIKGDIQRKSIEQNTARLNIAQARERMEEEVESAASLQQEEQEIQEKTREIRTDKESVQQELIASEALEARAQEEIARFQQELEERRRAETEAAAAVSEWDLKVEKLRQSLGFQQSNADRIDGEIQRARAELEEVLEALRENGQAVESKQRTIEEIQKTITASYDAQNESEARLKEDMAQREELSARQKSFFARREELAQRQSALDKEVYRLNAQKERMEESMESQINYMWDEYEITLSDAASLRDGELTDLAAMKKEITSLRDQIRKLGDVNVNAIEDYKNLLERYTFMSTQRDDLVEAEKTLENIIQELDAAMRKQFAEKFAEIGREFDKVFKELFGGGRGTLELIEDEDILEAGIRIIAQPPGKKLQNMMQLSGGEKALTAISLLFAIQNLKPSPFCLLDEIEAALDDSNVGRFAKYLHKLTKNTQFIVITHRRGTMEQVDRLYGITMQEKGVSTLVSVNLIDKELTA